jgi:hypothetical protein
MGANKYAGACAGCGQRVAAYAGIYDAGVLKCADADSSALPDPSRATWWRWCDSVAPVSCAALFARFMREQMAPDVVAERAAAAAAELAALDVLRESWRAELVDGGALAALAAVARVRSLDDVIVKVCGPRFLAGLSWEHACAVRNELQARIDRRDRAAANKANGGASCRKCSGAGTFWQMTAGGQWADGGCWRCGGSGKEPRRGA